MTIQIFVISLQNSPRRKTIQQQFEKFDIPYTLFNAVDCRGSVPPEYEKMVNQELANKRYGHYLSDGEIGCALSHHLVYKYICDNDIEHAIIMEDDAILTDDFKTFYDNAVYKKCGADMVFLFHYGAFVGTEYKSYYNNKYYTLAHMPYGAVGYYVTTPTAQALYTANTPICYTSDFPTDLTDTFNIQAVYPRIIQHPEQSHQQSTLKKGRYNNLPVNTKYSPFKRISFPQTIDIHTNKNLAIIFFTKWKICQKNKFCISPTLTGDRVIKYNVIIFIIQVIYLILAKINNKIQQKK